jgi:hypothetical protein
MWDRDTHAANVEAVSDGLTAGVVSTDIDRPDIAATHPGAPLATGFRLRLSRPVSSPVCVIATNSNGDRANLGCLPAPPATRDGSPIGNVDEVRAEVGRVLVRGWVVDPDPDAPVNQPAPARGDRAVEVYVDGHWFMPLNANKPRPDIAALIPNAGSNDGFEVLLPARPGLHEICVYAINQGRTGRNSTLGCHDLDVPASAGTAPPLGSLDGDYLAGQTAGTANHSLGVRGWAMTPTGGPVRLRVVALGGFYANPEQLSDQTGSTGAPRPDISALYPIAPPDAGYEIVAGQGHLFYFRLACVTAQSLDTGDETALGCVTNSANVGDRF